MTKKNGRTDLHKFKVSKFKNLFNYYIERYSFLDFKGMGITDRVPVRLSLLEMYIPLKARFEIPQGESWSRRTQSGNALVISNRQANEDIGLSQSIPILDLIKHNKCLVILGDPGAGKTTLLKYLTLSIATGKGSEIDINDRIPILIPLSAYAHELQNEDIPLDKFIQEYYSRRINQFNVGVIDEIFASGKALLLLDGLDEVGELSHRHFTLNRVMDFLSVNLKLGNKFVITSRVVGYKEIRLMHEDIVECTLVDLDKEEIEKFVIAWTNEMEEAVRGNSSFSKSEANREKEELLVEINHNSNIRQLSANPLLLTILVLMKRQGILLPDKRVELYQKYIDILINQWNLTRGLDRSSGQVVNISEVIKILAPLALWMHIISSRNGLIKGKALLSKLIELYEEKGYSDPEAAAEKFFTDIHDHAGLIVERGADDYCFIHLTFQEYLSAVAIAQKGQKDVKPLITEILSHINDESWHEIIILSLGYIGNIQQRDEAAGTILEAIVNSQNCSQNALLLAGEAVIDIWPGGVNELCKITVTTAIRKMVTSTKVITSNIRCNAGDQLARLGDTRPGVGIDAKGLPDIKWCNVPPKSFLMGNFTNIEDTIAEENPQMQINLRQYKISKYPITCKQYDTFVIDHGYSNIWQNCWTDDGWLWKKDKFDRIKLGDKFDFVNHPLVMITWYEAIAFCTWLEERWKETGIISQNTIISLPTEAQWEKAARGLDGRVYPWGKSLSPNFANYRDSGNNSTSSVGIFPSGKSPFGLVDMSGNMWEWCLTKYCENYSDYPKELFEYNKNSLIGSLPRIIRGGSFNDQGGYLRCAARNWNQPDVAIRDIGFRIVMNERAE